MNSFKWIWSHLRVHRFKVLLGLLMVLSVVIMNLANPLFMGRIVDKVIVGKQTDLLPSILLTLIGVTVLKTIIKYLLQIIFENVSQDTVNSIRENIYTRLQQLDFEFFDKNKTGDIMARMTGDTEAIRHFTAWVIYVSFENLVTLIYAIGVMFWIDVPLTISVFILTPITGYFGYKLSDKVKPTFMAIRDQFSRLNSVVQENISGNRVVKAFAKEDYEIEKFEKENTAFMNRNLDSAKVWEAYLPILDSAATLISVAVILVGGIMVIEGRITIGELVVFNGMTWALSNPMRMFGWLINDFQRTNASAEKIIQFMQNEPRIKNNGIAFVKEMIDGFVEFRNVSFHYENEPILDDISFKAEPGQTVGIIGPTGSGKSTLVNLICRFYDCTDGGVLIDRINVKNMDISKLRESISFAMQDIFLFSNTIEGNIAYGVPHASSRQVEMVAAAAGAHHFIVNFTEGYDTIVGERGVGLSGGQKQRIALARALLKNPSILILDDTTSAVDMETEHAIQKTLKKFARKKTTFVIAHRISSVKNADQILVLDQGKIVERGTHEELLAQGGYYYNVYSTQFGDFDKSAEREVI